MISDFMEREERRRITGPVTEQLVWRPMGELHPHIADGGGGTVDVLVVFGGKVEPGLAVLDHLWPDLRLRAVVLLSPDEDTEPLDAEHFTAWAPRPRGPVPDA